MKKVFSLLFAFQSLLLLSQHTVFSETGLNKYGTINIIGYQFQPKKSSVGFFISYGGNLLDGVIGLDTKYIMESEGDFTSTVSWYTKDGTYLPTLPPNEMFTSPEWGNRLLESGTCVNTVEIWLGDIQTTHRIYNAGIVLSNPRKNLTKLRLGLGVHHKIQKGLVDYSYWQHTFRVSKYYDEWGVVAQPSGIFVVERTLSVREWEQTKQLNSSEFKVNFSAALDYELQKNTSVSLGYNTQVGFNLGIGYVF